MQFLGVDIKDPSPDDALRLLAGSGVRYPSLSDYSSTTKPGLRWSGPPMTVLVRADGTIAYRKVGELASADELRRLIADHLGVDGAGVSVDRAVALSREQLPHWLDPVVHVADEVSGDQLSRHLPPPAGGRDSAVLILFGERPSPAARTPARRATCC